SAVVPSGLRRLPIGWGGTRTSPHGTEAPAEAQDTAGPLPGPRGRRPWVYPTAALPRSPSECPPAEPVVEGSSHRTAGSTTYRGYPPDWLQTPLSTVHLHQPLRGWPLPS